jgi:hypothetical protein
MGYIICDNHGGNIVSLISDYHAEKINNRENSIDSEILYIEVLDNKGLFNGHYLVDPNLVKEIGIITNYESSLKEINPMEVPLKINMESEYEKYERLFTKLSPICPKCLKDYLKKEDENT